MSPSQMATWLTVAAMLVAAGIWLGALNQRVAHLESRDQFVHGSYALPSVEK